MALSMRCLGPLVSAQAAFIESSDGLGSVAVVGHRGIVAAKRISAATMLRGTVRLAIFPVRVTEVKLDWFTLIEVRPAEA